jgi:CRP-like cAMP-binding protein
MTDTNDIRKTACGAVRENPLLGDLLSAADREFLVEQGRVIVEDAGAVLCRQHQQDTRVFIILDGSVEVTEEVQGRTITIRTLHTGELFGEIAALFMMPRIATVTVTQPAVFLEIPGHALEQLVERLPKLREAVFERYRERMLHSALLAVPGFTPLPEDVLQAISSQASLVSYRKGDAIFKEGEQGDALYVINYGVAHIYVTRDSQVQDVATAGLGDFLGERSLLTGAPLAASAQATTQLEVVRVEREAFLRFMQDYPEVWDSFDVLSHERYERLKQIRPFPV